MGPSRKILADNVKSLIDKDGLTVRGFAMRHKIQQKTVDRLVKQENAVSIDTLDELAAKLGIHSWQLLIPGLDLSHPPAIALSESELRLYERLRMIVKS